MGQGQRCEVQHHKVPGPTLGSQQSLGMLQAWERAAGKLPIRKRPGGVGTQQLNMNQVCPDGQGSQWHLGCTKNSVASRNRAVKLCHYIFTKDPCHELCTRPVSAPIPGMAFFLRAQQRAFLFCSCQVALLTLPLASQ